MNIVGQKKLLSLIDSFNLSSFPHSILLTGERGSGKHLITQYISEKFKLPLFDITDKLSDEFIDEIYRKSSLGLYLIDLSKLTEKEQNIMLKFVEEPLKNSFIILITNSKSYVLDTIINRCYNLEMNKYSKEELETFVVDKNKKEIILNLLNTPGKIRNLNTNTLDSLFDTCNKIVDKIEIANFANTLTIADKLNYKDEFDKFDVETFYKVLMNCMNKKYIESKDKKYFNYYNLTLKEYKKLELDDRLEKKEFTYCYLTRLWKLSRGI